MKEEKLIKEPYYVKNYDELLNFVLSMCRELNLLLNEIEKRLEEIENASNN